MAAVDGKIEQVKFLLRTLRIDVNIKNSNGTTPLMAASSWQSDATKQVVELLLADPITDINATNDSGETALDIAVQHKFIDSVNLLLNRKNIDIHIKDNAGQTPLDIATNPTIKSLLQNHLNK